MLQNIHIITLGVEDLNKSLDFYEKGLGWKKSSHSKEEIAFFKLGAIVFSLYPKKELAKDIGISPSSTSKIEGTGNITLAYNTKSEREVDETLAKVEALGAEIVKPGQKVFWGGYSGYFKDLDGHLFEVAYNPFVGFDEKNNLILD